MTKGAKDHLETELKFELHRRAARKVRHHPLLADGGHDVKSQTSIYFDTHRGRLHDAGYSLRVRQVGEEHFQTVKTNGGGAGLFDRGEWEAPVESMSVDFKALKKTPLRKLKKLAQRLEPTIQSEVERSTWLIDRDGSVVEVVLDSGTVSAAEAKEEFQELELELKAGVPEAMFELVRELAHDIPLEVGVLSKEERGRMLAKQAFDHEQKARRPHIARGLSTGQAFTVIVHECIRHFRLNQALILAERNSAALHQGRVAMRRLRTAFVLFRPAIRQASLEPLRAELRDFMGPFGEARNLDVYLDNHAEELGWHDRRKLRSARANYYDEVIEALQSQRSRDMLMDLVEWTALGDWQRKGAGEPIETFAAKQLDRAWRKVKRGGAKLSDCHEEQLHRLRIDVKKLRYSVEFLAPLYRRKQVRRFAASLEALQDCLGLIHDDMVGRKIVSDFGLGEVGRTDVSGRSRQLKKIDTRFKRLKKIGAFWA